MTRTVASRSAQTSMDLMSPEQLLRSRRDTNPRLLSSSSSASREKAQLPFFQSLLLLGVLALFTHERRVSKRAQGPSAEVPVCAGVCGMGAAAASPAAALPQMRHLLQALLLLTPVSPPTSSASSRSRDWLQESSV